MAPACIVPGSLRSVPISIDDDVPVTEAEKTAARLRNKYLHDRTERNLDLSAGLTREDAIEIEEDLAKRAGLSREEIEEETRFIDLTEDDGEADEATFYHYGDFPDPTPVATFASGERELRRYVTKSGLELRKGMTIEFNQPLQEFEAEFLKIAAIIKRNNGGVVLRGHIYTRARHLGGILERKLNEVVLVADVVRDYSTDWNVQAMVDQDPEDVKRVRILRTTNTAHPLCGIDRHDYDTKGRQWVIDEGHLVCRWHYIFVFKDERMRNNHKIDEWILRRVTKADSDQFCAVEDEDNTNMWRGGNILGGSVTREGIHENTKVIDLDYVPLPPAQMQQELEGRSYSGGDLFAGAGGISRGMQDASIKPIFAVDHWKLAAATYAKNFKEVDLYESDIFDFIIDETIKHRVDILHLSPPCQYWSPAHTVPGQNDEPNVAALYACGHIIEKIRPRIFTIEQTFGILFKRFEAYFNTFIGGFTSHGYSVRWKIVHFGNWGLCQTRQRLIVIGAAPGEHLPDFPMDTHSEKANRKQGRKAFTTVHDVFKNVTLMRDCDQHDLTRVEQNEQRYKAWDEKRQVGTITCSGGQNNYHWSGKRQFTIREYACMQGFPLHHSFKGSRSDCIRQIGNAVPPTMAKRLYDHIVHFLKIQDGATPPASRAARSSAARQRLEMMKIETPVEANDYDLALTITRAIEGASAGQAIVVDSSSDEDAEDGGSEDEDEDAACVSGDEDDETATDHDQKPADETSKLSPGPNKRAFSNYPTPEQSATDDAHIDDAASESTCTIVGDYQRVDWDDSNQRRCIITPVSIQARLRDPGERLESQRRTSKWQQQQAVQAPLGFEEH